MKLLLILALLIAPLAFAEEVGVSASVSCNAINAGYSPSCWDDSESVVPEKNNQVGRVMWTPFFTIWISPTLMLFWTPEAWWWVDNGIIK